MLTITSWFGNLSIYYDNLSTYYVFTILLSFLAVFLTWWFQETQSKHLQHDMNETEKDDHSPETIENESIVTHYKKFRQKAIAEQLSAGLTPEQLEEEKEMEKKQLEAILQLLKEQEDKFHVNSMEELEDQLRLYRR
ncbi:hypothetical protein L9F63_003417 [Diploptera punctata]|uniref:Matrix-remodeling-associated protein 7 helical domain-containing protein n=1 Tax=Diploptera punctata TaxID=6984 RepID=A0AAD7ZKM2_DIPPU|nr:hypothetical protein L9F63_003417 [Diploptera punctata]